MDNPNEYDDDAFTQASLEFQNDVTTSLEMLWKTGARISDVESDLASAITDALDIGDCRVQITITESD